MRPHGTKKIFRQPDRSAADVRVDVNDEVGFHIDMRTEDLMKDGTSAEDARRQALAGIRTPRSGSGGNRAVRRPRRKAQAPGALRRGALPGRRARRSPPGPQPRLRPSPPMLALGIGANTAIYSVLDAVLLRPLPYPNRTAWCWFRDAGGRQSEQRLRRRVPRLARRTRPFDALTLTGRSAHNLRGDGAPERLDGHGGVARFLQVLGIPPFLGRGFLPDEDRPGGPNDVVMITEEFWRSRFGADRAIVGRTIVLDEVPRTVIGVLPGARGSFRTDTFFVPAVFTPGTPRAARAPHWAGVFGRLRPTRTVRRPTPS